MSINLMDGFIMKCVDCACDGRLAYQLAHFLLLCRASQRRNISSSSIVQSIFHLASQSICCAYVKHPFPLSHFAHVNSGFPLAPTWIPFLFASQDLPWRCADHSAVNDWKRYQRRHEESDAFYRLLRRGSNFSVAKNTKCRTAGFVSGRYGVQNRWDQYLKRPDDRAVDFIWRIPFIPVGRSALDPCIICRL